MWLEENPCSSSMLAIQLFMLENQFWDTSLLVLYLIQQCSWGCWFTVATNFCNAHHMTEGHDEGGGGLLTGSAKIELQLWNPENSWCRSECEVWSSVCSKPTGEVIKHKRTTVECVPRVFEDIHFETFIEDTKSQLWSKNVLWYFHHQGLQN